MEKILLPYCAWCKKIRIKEDPVTWMSRERNEKLYDLFMKEFKGDITDGICQECAEGIERGY